MIFEQWIDDSFSTVFQSGRHDDKNVSLETVYG